MLIFNSRYDLIREEKEIIIYGVNRMDIDLDGLRRGSRKRYFEIWQKMKNNEPLEGEEAIIGKVMLEHTEFHNTWEFADVLSDVEYNVGSEINPYLHVVVHTIIERQLALNKPKEVRFIYDILRAEGIDRHSIIHKIGSVLLEEIISILQLNQQFSSAHYINKLQSLVYHVRKNNHP